MMGRQQLIDGLNEDLAAELGTIIRYKDQAGKSEGPVGRAADEAGHAREIQRILRGM